jgi:5-methylcytosine-specific restriction endonuclease McrA
MARSTTPSKYQGKHLVRLARITGSELQRIRNAWRLRQPLCAGPDSLCEKKRARNPDAGVRLWDELDHIVSLEDGGVDSHNPFKNRQGLCRECHLIKTYGSIRRPIGVDGWPIEALG